MRNPEQVRLQVILSLLVAAVALEVINLFHSHFDNLSREKRFGGERALTAQAVEAENIQTSLAPPTPNCFVFVDNMGEVLAGSATPSIVDHCPTPTATVKP